MAELKTENEENKCLVNFTEKYSLKKCIFKKSNNPAFIDYIFIDQ